MSDLDELYESIVKDGNIYIDIRFDKSEVGPHEIIIAGKYYFRFMDFFYLPCAPHDLSDEGIIEICNLRIRYWDKVVDQKLNSEIVESMVIHVKNILRGRDQLKILDFGCGTGYSASLIKRYSVKSEIVGVDINLTSVRMAVYQGIEARHITSGLPLPFASCTFDAVFAVFVMHFHVNEHSLKEVERVLKHGGVFIFNIYNQDPSFYEDAVTDAGLEGLMDIGWRGCKGHRILVCAKR
jgi:SAM-dependent methyltransferase